MRVIPLISTSQPAVMRHSINGRKISGDRMSFTLKYIPKKILHIEINWKEHEK